MLVSQIKDKQTTYLPAFMYSVWYTFFEYLLIYVVIKCFMKVNVRDTIMAILFLKSFVVLIRAAINFNGVSHTRWDESYKKQFLFALQRRAYRGVLRATIPELKNGRLQALA